MYKSYVAPANQNVYKQKDTNPIIAHSLKKMDLSGFDFDRNTATQVEVSHPIVKTARPTPNYWGKFISS